MDGDPQLPACKLEDYLKEYSRGILIDKSVYYGIFSSNNIHIIH